MRIFSILILLPAVASAVTQTFTLEHRHSSQLAPIIQPLLLENEKMVPYQATITLDATPERLQELSQVIQSMDTPQTSFKISFSMGHDRPDIHFREYEANVKDFSKNDRHYTRKQISNTRSTLRNIKNIRVLNGESAHIDSTYVIALLDYQTSADGNAQWNFKADYDKLRQVFEDSYSSDDERDIQEQETITSDREGSASREYRFHEFGQHYESFKDSLYVTANLIGNKALVEIFAHEGQNQSNPIPTVNPHYVQTQLVTKVLLPTNEWIYLGGNRTTNDMMTEGYHFQTQVKDIDKHHVWIKIEKVN